MKSVIDLKDRQTAPVTWLPDQIVDEYGEEQYLGTLRFIASQWNNPMFQETEYTIPRAELGLPVGFSTRCFIWYTYYFKENWNKSYWAAVTKAPDGQRLPIKMFRSGDISKYINYCLDPVIDIVKRIPKVISATTVSEDVVSEKRMLQDIGKYTADQKHMTAYLNEKAKMWLETGNGIKFLEDAGRNLEAVDFREELTKAASNIGKDVYYRNNLHEQLVDAGKYAFLTGLGDVKVSIFNGYPLVEVIPSFQSIFPPSLNGDQHRQDQFGGRIQFLTVTEIAAKYPLTTSQLKKLQTIANNKDGFGEAGGWNYINTQGGTFPFYWWSDNFEDRTPRAAVVEGQWASYVKEDAEEGRQTLREGVLVGNLFMVECKITENQTTDWRNPLNTDLDYIRCQPMSFMGRNMGIPEMLYTYVDTISYMETKIDEWIRQTKGTFYAINGSYLDEAVNPVDIMSDITTSRITVVKGVDEDAGDTMNKLMQQGAIEMPRDVVAIINRIATYKQMMADILNIPDAARGQIEGYVPEKTLNFQQSQSGKGTRYFYDPLNVFFERIIQKAVDKFKTSMLVDNERVNYMLRIGDTAVELFKSNRKFSLSQQAIYVGFDDIADDGFKQRQLDIMFNLTQQPNSGYTMTDYSAIECLYTKSEIRNYFQYRDLQIKRERQAQEQAAIEQAAIEKQAALDTTLDQTEMQIQGNLESQAMALDSKEDIEADKLAMQAMKTSGNA